MDFFRPRSLGLRRRSRRRGCASRIARLLAHFDARTLAEWRKRFEAHWPEIEAQGFDQRFRRLWDYYLCYSAGGFAEGVIDVGLYGLELAAL